MKSITITVSDPFLVEWIGGLKKADRDEEVGRVLRVGKMVLGFAQISSNADTLADYFSPITEKMDELNSTLDGVIRRSAQPDGRGQMGEGAVLTALQVGNQRDTLLRVGPNPKSGDIEATFDIKGVPTTALVEVKTYSKPVPAAEVKKFESDLDTQAKPYGLFISIGQRISGLSGRLTIRDTSKGVRMYLGEADQSSLLLAYDLFKYMVERHQCGHHGTVHATQAVWARLMEEVSEMASVEKVASELEVSARANEDAARETLAKVRSLRQFLSHSLQNLRKRIREFDLLAPEGTEIPALTTLPADSRPLAPTPPVAKIAQNPTPKSIWEANIIETLRNANTDVQEAGDRWMLYRFGQYLGTVTPKESAPKAYIQVEQGKAITLRKGEQFPQGSAVVEISGPAATFADRLVSRIAGG